MKHDARQGWHPNKAGRTVSALLAVFLLMLFGCDDPPAKPTERADATEPAAAEVLPDDNSAAGDIHSIAGRSAFPAEGESIDRPIPAARLSEEDQFAEPIDPADIPDIVRWQDAGRYVGHDITVQGRVVHLGQSRDGQVNFLNFDPDWRGKFYMVVFDDLATTLDASVEQVFKDKLVRVTGKVDTHRGRPQIRITSMEQVEFVGE